MALLDVGESGKGVGRILLRTAFEFGLKPGEVASGIELMCEVWARVMRGTLELVPTKKLAAVCGSLRAAEARSPSISKNRRPMCCMVRLGRLC